MLALGQKSRAKSIENRRKKDFGQLTFISNVITDRVIHYIWVKHFFSQFGLYGYQQTRNFT
jgi:hypothetical protein